MAPFPPVPRIGFVSLGCPKALVDSEQILTQLRAEGYETSKSYDGADLVIVNTCGFIDAAVQESLDAIGEALAENGKVIVTGCLGAKKDANGDDIVAKVHPRVLAVTGPHAAGEVMRHVHVHLPRPHNPFVDLAFANIGDHGVKLTPKHYAYLKISEGCNHRCSFCIIPSMRGDLVSRPIGEVMREAESLLKSGVKELLVISQDTSAYGVDLRYRTDFVAGRPVKTRMTELVNELATLTSSDEAWVRLHYVYPYPHVDDVLPLMADGKVLPYLDVPFQHAHPDVLKRMKRPASGEKNLDRIQAWRAICPDLTIRSTFIAGFPGETEAQFEYLLDFLREAELDRVGCFAYSPVDGASANQLDGALPDEVREERRSRFMAVQEEISARRIRRHVGKLLRVLIDDINPDGGVARSFADAPEIDGNVFVAPPGSASAKLAWRQKMKVGAFVTVRVTGADGHDLWGDLA
ncbi:MAG: 30S ribosomal protein S12 methylthiotransferase RimO [Burkholderiaceae bacterium]